MNISMKKLCVLSVFSVGVLCLAACSTTGGGRSSANMPKTTASDYTKLYAIPGQSSYRGDVYKAYRNPLRAPANQVYYFAFDSSKLRPNDLRALRIQANYLAAHPNARIRLEGNTDNRGSREYNIALGWRRDQSVARLLKQWGVNPKQIAMVSYGKEHPVVAANNERAWALNRRVNLVYKVQQ